MAFSASFKFYNLTIESFFIIINQINLFLILT